MEPQSQNLIVESLNLWTKNQPNSISAGVESQKALLELGNLIKFQQSHAECDIDKPEE